MVQKIGSKANLGTRNRKEKINENTSKLLFSISQQQHRKRFMGVRQSSSGRWVAEIKGTAQKIRLWLGTFDTPEDAAHAYDEAACLLRGNNTRTNFWPRSTGEFSRSNDSNANSSSVLSAKVLNHLLNHLNTQRANKSAHSSASLPSKPPILLPPQYQHQQQNHDQELELISRMNYDELYNDFSTSNTTTQSGDKKEYSMGYENNIHDEMEGKVELERAVNLVDMDLRLEDLSYFFTPFETEGREMVEIGTYEYWSMLYDSSRGV